MNNNPILEANLTCISKYNPDLKYQIMRIDSLKNDISIVNTILQEPNMMFNGVYLHNNYGAEAEAKEIFAKVENNSSTVHVIFGFGLGYLFQELALHSKGTVIVYEPNYEILAATLEIVDFTKELSKDNVFLFSDIEELKKTYAAKCAYKSNTKILFLPSYRQLFNSELNLFANELNSIMCSVVMNYNYIKQKTFPSIKMLCENIDLLVKEPPLGVFKDLYKGKTAVIVSAGPTLDRDINVLRQYRENTIIFSVGQAVRTLINNSITPDFVGIIEASNQMSQIEGLDLSEVDFILEPITYNELHKTKFRNIISFPSQTSVPNLIWTGYSNIDASMYFSSGTVSYILLYSAKILGFKDIILVGQDLAYIDGKCYTKGACQTGLRYEYDSESGKAVVKVEDFELFKNTFNDKSLSEEQKNKIANMRLDFINENLYFVKGIKGNNLPTTKDYYSFVAQFEDFAAKFKNELNLYNTSLEGAKIEGFTDMPLEDLLINKTPISRINLQTDFAYDISTIKSNISQELKIIDEITKMLKMANTLVVSYDKEFNNRKVVNESCMRYFKQLLVMYFDLNNIYCQKSRLFKYLQKVYSLDLDYNIRVSGGANPETISLIYQYIKIYVISLMSNLAEISTILKSKEVILNEMLNTKG